MKYTCLVFDHDDTVVNSTATIHYPAFQAYLDRYFPGKSCTLEQYFEKNFDPGFLPFCREEYGMTDADLDVELGFWQSYVRGRIPKAYAGIRELMERHKAEGGILAVVSHSMRENILRDYAANGLPEPDIVFGWDAPPEFRKPNPWPLEQIRKKFALKPEQMLMIDDLKPGYDMAHAAEVPFAAAGWANDLAVIRNFMQANCSNYFRTVEELRQFLEE